MYPQLTESDLATAWEYLEAHPKEIMLALQAIDRRSLVFKNGSDALTVALGWECRQREDNMDVYRQFWTAKYSGGYYYLSAS